MWYLDVFFFSPLVVYVLVLGELLALAFSVDRARAIRIGDVSWKRKRTAVLLAVITGPLSWVYTGTKDAGIAAVSISTVLGILVFPASITAGYCIHGLSALNAESEAAGVGLLAIIVFTTIAGLFFLTCFWVFAIADASFKNKIWYSSKPRGRSKQSAVLLAAFFGPWSWLYTLAADRWKFVAAQLMGWGGLLAGFVLSGGRGLTIVMSLTVMGVFWVVSIVNAARRNQSWYSSFPEPGNAR